MVLLFPSLALGDTVKGDDLVERNGLLYKKFTNVPFSGNVTGKKELLKNGKRDGLWEWYDENGQLLRKGYYKNENIIKLE